MSESTMVAPVIDNIEEKQSTPTKSMPVKTKLKDYRQKLMTLKVIVNMRSKDSENISRMIPFRKE